MQSILEKACQTLAGESMASGSYKGSIGSQGVPDVGTMKEFCPPLNFPPFQDLTIYGGHNDHQQLDHIDGFMPTNNNNDSICAGKKRSSPYGGSGKSPMIWPDDLRLHEFGTTLGTQDDPFKGADPTIQIAPPPSTDLDSISDIYETKPMLSGDTLGDKKFEASTGKLERPSPRRTPLSNTMMSTSGGITVQGRNSSFG